MDDSCNTDRTHLRGHDIYINNTITGIRRRPDEGKQDIPDAGISPTHSVEQSRHTRVHDITSAHYPPDAGGVLPSSHTFMQSIPYSNYQDSSVSHRDHQRAPRNTYSSPDAGGGLSSDAEKVQHITQPRMTVHTPCTPWETMPESTTQREHSVSLSPTDVYDLNIWNTHTRIPMATG